jgi:hypothetical protein
VTELRDHISYPERKFGLKKNNHTTHGLSPNRLLNTYLIKKHYCLAVHGQFLPTIQGQKKQVSHLSENRHFILGTRASFGEKK